MICDEGNFHWREDNLNLVISLPIVQQDFQDVVKPC